MTTFLTLDNVEVAGRTVLVRSDLNVPLEEGSDGPRVADDFRIRAALPTLDRLRKAGAVVVVASHLGRPKGDVKENLRLDPVAVRLSELGGFPVRKLDAVRGPQVSEAVAGAEPGSVILLENTRFEPGETRNDPDLARDLADGIDLFVLDAFGTAHRAHASTVGVTEHVQSVAGPLLLAEVTSLERLLDNPDRPFVVVLGGAKVSDKLGVINALLPKVDTMAIGGGMCFTLFAAQGSEIGTSLFEEERLGDVREVLAHAEKLVLPTDVVVADRFAEDAGPRVVGRDEIPADTMGLDIGPDSATRFAELIRQARSVFWNGPMGVFEWESFRNGTETVGEALRGHPGYTVVGGGDSVAAVRMLGLEDEISHVSTGGGAGLEMLEGKELPGITALKRWAHAT